MGNPSSKVFGIGESIYFVVDYLAGSSGEECFDGGFFYNFQDMSIIIVFSTVLKFSKICEDHVLASAVKNMS